METQNIDVSEKPHTSNIKTRVFAFVTLLSFAGGLAWLGNQGYRALTDSFVAPIILSPDSDLVTQNKVKLAEAHVEHEKTVAELADIDADIAVCDKATQRLNDLRDRNVNSMAFSKKVNAGQAFAAQSDLKALAAQKQFLATMLEKQNGFAANAKAEMDAGLISRSDYTKEAQAVNQLQIAQIENDRARLATEMQMKQVTLSQIAFAGGTSLQTPEQLVREDQLVRVELEMMKLDAERRKKTTERRIVSTKLAKIDEVMAHLKSRPIYRAVEKSMDVAFVPYSQLEGMHQGDVVYDCVWGVFHCKKVGAVSEMVPGEVILPDPWGTQARGELVVLDLANEHESAKSKTLRVRLGKAGTQPAKNVGSQPVAAK